MYDRLRSGERQFCSAVSHSLVYQGESKISCNILWRTVAVFGACSRASSREVSCAGDVAAVQSDSREREGQSRSRCTESGPRRGLVQVLRRNSIERSRVVDESGEIRLALGLVCGDELGERVGRFGRRSAVGPAKSIFRRWVYTTPRSAKENNSTADCCIR